MDTGSVAVLSGVSVCMVGGLYLVYQKLSEILKVNRNSLVDLDRLTDALDPKPAKALPEKPSATGPLDLNSVSGDPYVLAPGETPKPGTPVYSLEAKEIPFTKVKDWWVELNGKEVTPVYRTAREASMEGMRKARKTPGSAVTNLLFRKAITRKRRSRLK